MDAFYRRNGLLLYPRQCSSNQPFAGANSFRGRATTTVRKGKNAAARRHGFAYTTG
jgi:hypothetical protein